MLNLCLKAFDQFVARLASYGNLDVIRSLVNLAGMGTGLSKLWLVSDLEVTLVFIDFLLLLRSSFRETHIRIRFVFLFLSWRFFV